MIQWVCCRGSFQPRKKFPMGRYSKGKKLPKGISQRKDDGKFIAGFVDQAGKRRQRRFDTMVEADR